MLWAAQGLRAVVRRRHAEMSPRIRSTLERRACDEVPSGTSCSEVSGQLGLSDFTDMGDLGVMIAGERLKHRVYHFRLAYSGWEFQQVLDGESFATLAKGLHYALWGLGWVPREHSMDGLSAAFRNLERNAREDVTPRNCAPDPQQSRRRAERGDREFARPPEVIMAT
jgi:hypothetical protein